MAKKIVKECEYYDFLDSLPHESFEENLLHAFILSNEKSPVAECIVNVEHFINFIDNWAVCDQLVMKCFAKKSDIVYPFLKKCMGSESVYVRRFGIVNSMRFFLDEKFESFMLDDVILAITDDYYVQMAAAWYFATALAKQYDFAISFIEQRKLGKAVHKKTIAKALDSFRVNDERKAYLKSLK